MHVCFIVDDHDDTRIGYAEYLKNRGFEVHTAEGPDTLDALLGRIKPAAILMDLRLPKVDGWTLTRMLRADPQTRDIRIVVVSACVTDADRLEAENAGADAFISKPCDPEAIVSELHRLLGMAGC